MRLLENWPIRNTSNAQIKDLLQLYNADFMYEISQETTKKQD